MTTLPFANESTDTVMYGCKDACMSPCEYAAMYVARSKSVHSGLSLRDKTHTNI